jgi:uncharacterized protein (TIGR02597 family)
MKKVTCAITATITLLSMAIPPGFAQPVAAVPIGCMPFPVTTGATRSFGVPLLDLPTHTGKATAVTANTLTATDVNWTANTFVTNGPYFAAIRSGPQAGRLLLITANTNNTVTVDTEDTPLNTAGFAVTATVDTFEVFKGDTLGTLFGTTANGSGILSTGIKGGTTDATADIVQVFNGTAFVSYFFNTTAGVATWVQVGGGTTSQNGIVVYPDEGMLVTRRGTNGNLTFVGRVPATDLKTRLPGGTTNVIAVRFPANTTLGGLNFGAPGAWITGASEAVADNVKLWNGTAWDTYYKNASNLWIKVGGTGTDQSAVAIPSGTAVQIIKRGSATGSAAFYTQSLPYTL